ncbi:MAG: dipeptidase [Acidilobaceae archaeon]
MASKVPVVDLHEDISTYFMSHGGGRPLADLDEDVEGRDADLPKYRRGNVRVVFAAIFPGVETYKGRRAVPGVSFRAPQAVAMEQLSIYYRLAEAHPEVSIVESLSDIEKCLWGEWRLCLLLHLEGADALEEPSDLYLFKRLGLRSLGLTWSTSNKYGSGCWARRDRGLSDEGEELVKLANKLGVILDLAHASKRTAIEAIEASSKPPVISHANPRRLVDTPRNVDDEVLEALASKRGVLGITALPHLLTQRADPSLEDIVEHFAYVREVYGADVLAIGTDFFGFLGRKPPRGFESIDRVAALLAKLAERGFTDREVAKVAYENALRVIRENLS